MDELCRGLLAMEGELQAPRAFPHRQLQACAEAGVFEWFLPKELGGQGWAEADLSRGYIRLGAACLTTAFVITQRVGAMTRLAACGNKALQERLLPDLITGRSFATIGISHLTTSRRHLQRPVLRAEETADGFVLDGYSPWVTGAEHAQHVIVGAEMDDGRQVILALPTALPGVKTPPPPELHALNASCTGPLECERVHVPREWLMAGPMPEVMKRGLPAMTGGLQTSALALGLARAALDFLAKEGEQRPQLLPAHHAFEAEWAGVEKELLAAAAGAPLCSGDELRTQANSLVLRATQAALAAAKGAGFVISHPAGRWCREALFFLVWSCPPSVLSANLCELAGMES
jgi:alkylation response protein AidB-like acyl-CoA dehydrogenase